MEKVNNNSKKSVLKMSFSGILYIGYSRFKQNLKPLLIGQLLSVLLASSGAANDSLHFECNLSAPSLQAGLIYFFLSFSLIAVLRENRSVGNLGSSSSEPSPVDEDYHSERQSHQVSSLDIDSDNDRNNQTSTHGISGTQKLVQKISQQICPNHSIKGSPLMYFAMALLDVQANYFTFLAYRYTSLTSVSLLDAVAIPSSMVFSRLLLRRSYKVTHFLGAAICIAGVIVNVFVDYQSEGHDYIQEDDGVTVVPDFPNQLSGDVLAVIGATIYGLNNVLTERAVKNIGGVKEYLGMLGLFGVIISFIQGLILDRQAVLTFFTREDDNCSAARGFELLFCCAFFGVASYIGMSNFLTESEAGFLNLSLLTGDLWVVAFTVIVQNFIPSFHFWVALVLIFLGVIIYEVSGEPTVEEITHDDIQRTSLVRQRDDGITAQHLRELDMQEFEDESNSII